MCVCVKIQVHPTKVKEFRLEQRWWWLKAHRVAERYKQNFRKIKIIHVRSLNFKLDWNSV